MTMRNLLRQLCGSNGKHDIIIIRIYHKCVLQIVLKMERKIMPTLEEKIRSLPLALQEEVEDFVIFLSERQNYNANGKATLSWAGALKDMSTQYSSVELQHALTDWRSSQP